MAVPLTATEHTNQLIEIVTREAEKRYPTKSEQEAFKRGADWAFQRASDELNETFNLASKGRA